mgnify:CR=1 FL=1
MREWTRGSVRTIIMHIRCRQEDRVRATLIMANLRVADIETAKSFYTDEAEITKLVKRAMSQ